MTTSSTGIVQEFIELTASDGSPLIVPLPPPPPNADVAAGFLWEIPPPLWLLPKKYRPPGTPLPENDSETFPPKYKSHENETPSRLSGDEVAEILSEGLFRPLDWRWQLAGHLIASDRPPERDLGGDLILAWFYRHVRPRCHTDRKRMWLRIWFRYLHQAVRFREHRRTCFELEARCLAAEPVEQIAYKFNCAPEVIRLFGSLFFDVAGHLDATSWILGHVVRWHHELPKEPLEQLGRFWKYYGYVGGPNVVDDLVYGFVERQFPTTAAEIEDFFAVEAVQDIRRKAAMALHLLPVTNPKVAMRLFRAAQRLQEMKHRQERRQATPGVDFMENVRAALAQIPAPCADSPRQPTSDTSQSMPDHTRSGEILP